MKIELILSIIAVVLIGLLVAACCKIAGRESRKEEKEHPCAYCQRWGECNGVDETCPLLQVYEEARSAIRQPAFFRGRDESRYRREDDG